jgi:hypothetical protein
VLLATLPDGLTLLRHARPSFPGCRSSDPACPACCRWPTRSSPYPRSDDQYCLPWRCRPVRNPGSAGRGHGPNAGRARSEGAAVRNCRDVEATAGRAVGRLRHSPTAMLEVRSAGSPQILIFEPSRRVPCGDDIAISEQRFDFLASLPRVGGETCLLMEDGAHLRVNTTGFGKTFRKEP